MNKFSVIRLDGNNQFPFAVVDDMGAILVTFGVRSSAQDYCDSVNEGWSRAQK